MWLASQRRHDIDNIEINSTFSGAYLFFQGHVVMARSGHILPENNIQYAWSDDEQIAIAVFFLTELACWKRTNNILKEILSVCFVTTQMLLFFCFCFFMLASAWIADLSQMEPVRGRISFWKMH